MANSNLWANINFFKKNYVSQTEMNWKRKIIAVKYIVT